MCYDKISDSGRSDNLTIALNMTYLTDIVTTTSIRGVKFCQTGFAYAKKKKRLVEFQYGGRLGEFNGMSSHFQSHVSHCRVLPLGEFTVTIPEPHCRV